MHDQTANHPRQEKTRTRSGGQRNDDVVHDEINADPVQRATDDRPPRQHWPQPAREPVHDDDRQRNEVMKRETQRFRSQSAAKCGFAEEARGDALKDADRAGAAHSPEDDRVRGVERSDHERSADDPSDSPHPRSFAMQTLVSGLSRYSPKSAIFRNPER